MPSNGIDLQQILPISKLRLQLALILVLLLMKEEEKRVAYSREQIIELVWSCLLVRKEEAIGGAVTHFQFRGSRFHRSPTIVRNQRSALVGDVQFGSCPRDALLHLRVLRQVGCDAVTNWSCQRMAQERLAHHLVIILQE